MNKGYITLWGANDTLYFYGSFLSFLGTVALGSVTVYLSRKANETSLKMLYMQQAQELPLVDFKIESNSPDLLPIELYPFKDLEQRYIRLYIINNSSYVAKNIQITELYLYSYNNSYQLIKDEGNILRNRTLLNNNWIHFALYLEPVSDDSLKQKYNSYFEESSPTKPTHESMLTEQHYILDITVEIKNKYDKIIMEKIWCHFKRDLTNKEKFLIWNKEITLR